MNSDECATECNFCGGYGTVSTVKALQEENERLKREVKND